MQFNMKVAFVIFGVVVAAASVYGYERVMSDGYSSLSSSDNNGYYERSNRGIGPYSDDASNPKEKRYEQTMTDGENYLSTSDKKREIGSYSEDALANPKEKRFEQTLSDGWNSISQSDY